MRVSLNWISRFCRSTPPPRCPLFLGFTRLAQQPGAPRNLPYNCRGALTDVFPRAPGDDFGRRRSRLPGPRIDLPSRRFYHFEIVARSHHRVPCATSSCSNIQTDFFRFVEMAGPWWDIKDVRKRAPGGAF